MSHDGKPNPVVNAISDAIGALRADPDMHDLAKAHNDLEPKAIEELSVAEARRQPTIADAVRSLLQEQGRSTDPERLVPGVTRTTLQIPVRDASINALVYSPSGVTNPPVILYIHGGGWVIADAEVYDGGARGISKEAAAVVVSIDYRQAPEFRFPTAWLDCLDAWSWVTTNADKIGADPSRAAIAGESAGGCMAVATAIAARDAGLPLPKHVLAVYPVAQTGSMHTLSYVENAIAKPLNRAMIEWFLGHLLNSEDDKADTRLDLVNADLRGLPPVTIINAMLDPLRSDGEKLKDALEDAGVPVERELYTGVAHEFFGAAAVLEKAREAQAYAGERLKAHLFG